jgi:hypothetical protein
LSVAAIEIVLISDNIKDWIGYVIVNGKQKVNDGKTDGKILK